MERGHPAVVERQRPEERFGGQRRSGQRLVEDVAAHAAGERQDHLRHGSGEEHLLPGAPFVRAPDEFETDRFKLFRRPLLRRRLHAVFAEQIRVAEEGGGREVAGVGVLSAAVHQQIARRAVVAAGVEAVFAGEFRDVLKHAHRREPLYGNMVDQVARHAGDRLDQRALVVGSLELHGEERFAVFVHAPGFLHPLVKRRDLFDPVLRKSRRPGDRRPRLPLPRRQRGVRRREPEQERDYGEPLPHLTGAASIRSARRERQA